MAPPFADPPRLDNCGRDVLTVPGFGNIPLELELQPPDRFTHGMNEWVQSPNLTARELAMLALMNMLTDKPNWHKDVFDDSVISKWRDEALAMDLISMKAWEWCLAELKDKALMFEITGHVLVYNTGAGICKSDTVVTTDIQNELRNCIPPLLSLPDVENDWQASSNQQVHNIVDPMLFPLIYGKTTVLVDGGTVELDNMLEACGKGEIASEFSKEGVYLAYSASRADPPVWRRYHLRRSRHSTRFQRLPCEVEFVGDSGVEVRITSYINNLHPTRFRQLYSTIEKLIAQSIEPWNNILIKQNCERSTMRIRTWGMEIEPKLPDWLHFREVGKQLNTKSYQEAIEQVKAYWQLPEDHPKGSGINADSDLEELVEPADWDEWCRYGNDLGHAILKKFERLAYYVHPEPGTAFTYQQWKAGQAGEAIVKKSIRTSDATEPSPMEAAEPEPDHQFYRIAIQDSFRKSGLQVVVKIASIELTPENPNYPGSRWHSEGIFNEHVVATTLYVYDEYNTTEARVAFRQETRMNPEEFSYSKGDEENLRNFLNIFAVPFQDAIIPGDTDPGYDGGPPSLQELGSAAIPKGRLLAWPNVLHHCFKPFQLIDQGKPGRRSLITLSLVDPHYRVCSTRNVPPQRHDWWAEQALHAAVPDKCSVPREVIDIVDSYTDEWPMGLEEAKQLRLEMIKEQKHHELHIMLGSSYRYTFHIDDLNFDEPDPWLV